MPEVLLERTFDPPLTAEEALVTAGTHQVIDSCAPDGADWRMSFLSLDGRRMVCWFHGAGAGCAGQGPREAGTEVRRLWPGALHDAPEAGRGAIDRANVLVERSFPEPTPVHEVQALEDAGAACLQTHQVRFARTFASLDGRRMLCLYHAPDAESVRLAQRQAGVPFDRVWAFRQILPPAG